MRLNADGEARLHIFSTCRELIKNLPLLQIDEKRPTDCSTEPHEITHIPDALRYFAVSWARPAELPKVQDFRMKWTSDMWEDYNSASDAEREIMRHKWGEPN